MKISKIGVSVMVMSLELREITIVSGNRRGISSISKVSQ